MISQAEYAKRRQLLMKQIGPEGIVILPSSPEVLRNGDVHFPYRQSSDFYYLTGFMEPEAACVLLPKRKAGEYVLFNRVRDKDLEIWDGPRAGQMGACKLYLADEAHPIASLETMLAELLLDRKTIYYPIGQQPAFDAMILRVLAKVRSQMRSGVEPPTALADVMPLLHDMRLFKSSAEIAAMQEAANISADAHILAMQMCEPGKFEYELDAVFTYECKRQGALHPAYPSIVASGENTCVLHYVSNDKKIQMGDLVLIDAGAEYQYYASDITRTFPASGRFSVEQRELYEVVLSAQLAGIKAIKPGVVWSKIQSVIVEVITQGLVDLGILKGRLTDLIEAKAYLPYYMHSSGHWLGLDVHDVGKYKEAGKSRKLQPGMVLTVEPGLYLSANIKGLHKRWHNMGVRIEDDILVTKEGCRVLSHAIPKSVADIESIMAD
jgi:Xaa-Pro aminopeptidase